MPRDCFIDNNGRVFRSTSLWKAAENIPVSIYRINRETILSEIVMWKLDNYQDFLAHLKRVLEADLSIPIIVRSDGYVMDGWHRIIRALHEGKQELPQKKFLIDPEPDYLSGSDKP